MPRIISISQESLQMQQLHEISSNLGLRMRAEVRLADATYFRTGGISDAVYYPDSTCQLAALVAELQRASIQFKVIGKTTNLLFMDDGRYGVLIDTTALNQIKFHESESLIECETGVMLPVLARWALCRSIRGFAGMEGIPGTIGGAVFMNAAAYGDGMASVLHSVDMVGEDGSTTRIPVADLAYSYRDSAIKRGTLKGVILSATFHAVPGDQKQLYRRMEMVHAKRHKYNEYMYRNLGSVFAGSIYRELGREDLLYRFVASAYYLLNYRFKIFRRESPLNRQWLNDFTVKRFGITFERQPFSDKTMNTIVSNGLHSSEYVKYIEIIKTLTRNRLPVENEVVIPFPKRP